MKNTIKCKKCGEEIEISDALRHQLEETIRSEEGKKFKQRLAEAESQARRAAEVKLAKELKDKEGQINELKARAKKAEDEELKIRKEKRELSEAKEKFELEKERQLDEEREKIRNKAVNEVQEKDRLKFAEYEKKIADMNKALKEAERKGRQGSQQLQGEVLELDFEQLLETSFKNDKIEPVEKGVKGADVRQTVKSPRGISCGVILWETKRTKVWSDLWIAKLKDDLRAEKANIPVIVTAALPKEMDSELGIKDGVWVSSFSLALPLAQLLRKNLLDVGFQKAVSAHRGEKADHLYSYITSHEFRQQVEAMIEGYFQMKTQITKERTAYEKMWKQREKQVDRLFNSTANVVGAIQGEVGQTVFQIKGLELSEGSNEEAS